MQFKQNRESPKNQIGARQAMRLWSRGWGWALTCLVAVAAPAGLGRSLQVAGMQSRQPFIPSSAPMPDANKQREMQDEQTKKQNFEAANAERKKQIADDSAKLLKLATELKTEVDKTTKDELSLSVIRKADEIEKLAHNVKEKMKLTTGGN